MPLVSPRVVGSLVCFVLGMSFQSTYAQQAAAQYDIKADSPRLGSRIIHKEVTGATIPINRRYQDLTLEEKAKVNQWYESMGPGDEPPFPEAGLGAIYNAIRVAQHRFLVRGELRMAVTVNSAGEATEVQAMKSPSPEMTQFAATVLMLTKYKPAQCQGQPCQMQFPLTLDLAVE